MSFLNSSLDIVAKRTWICPKCGAEHDRDINAAKNILTEYAAGRCVANGDEAINSLYLSNAIYLSSWKNRKVALPVSGSRYELMFEKQFEKELEKKINKAIRRK